jgi:hypothetical protein
MADAWEHVQARPGAYRESQVHPGENRVMLPPRTISRQLQQLTSASTLISSSCIFPTSTDSYAGLRCSSVLFYSASLVQSGQDSHIW